MATARLCFLGVLCICAGCQDSRIPALEQRVKKLEESTRQLEAERAKESEDEVTRRAKLESCVADANTEFESTIIRNGTKQRNGTYNVPVPLSEQTLKQKQAKIEECRVLYGK